jgi:hypothetical protein
MTAPFDDAARARLTELLEQKGTAGAAKQAIDRITSFDDAYNGGFIVKHPTRGGAYILPNIVEAARVAPVQRGRGRPKKQLPAEVSKTPEIETAEPGSEPISPSSAGETDADYQIGEDAVPQRSWRDVLAIHPAAQLFERMGPDELKALGEDIKANGMKVPITILHQKGKPYALLDGQNRLDALEAVGFNVPALINACIELKPKPELQVHYVTESGACSALTSETVSPYAYVRSVNVNRRHLAPAKKAELIERLLKENPERSDRAIANDAKADHKTIAARRQELVATGDIPQLGKRTGADGKWRRQPIGKRTERNPYSAQKKQATEAAELTKQEPATPIVWVDIARAAIAKLEPDEQMGLFRDTLAAWQDKAKIEHLRDVLMVRLVEIEAAEVEATASKRSNPAAALQHDDGEGRTAR